MRLAVMSDIHANIVALEAVYRHMQSYKPDAIYCLGDLVNQNVWNNEVVAFMRATGIPCVLGNHDEGIGHSKPMFSFAYGSVEEYQYGRESIAFTLNQITDEHKVYLRGLPEKTEIEIPCEGKPLRIVMAHGIPGNNNRRLYHFLPSAEIGQVLTDTNADILFVGNTHWEYHKTFTSFSGGTPYYRHVINPGSVGCPKDGNWEPCYAQITIDEHLFAQGEKGAVEVVFPRIDYDLNKVIKAIQHSKLPLHYAARLLQ